MSKETSIPDLVRDIQDSKKQTVVQATKPVKKSKNENNDQCSFYISKELKKNLKFRAFEEGKTITEVIITSIESYLKA